MNNVLSLPNHVTQAGRDIAAQLCSANAQFYMGGLGGCKEFNLTEYPEQNHDLILAYLHSEIHSVEAIYIAMNRAMQ